MDNTDNQNWIKGEDVDLSFYTDPPELNTKAELTIEALAPLSMVTSQPGTYFRSEVVPSKLMVLGMLENALGWHFQKDENGKDIRKLIIKGLVKSAKKSAGRNTPFKDSEWLSGKWESSGSAFTALLTQHINLTLRTLPKVMSYDDLWSMHLHDKGGSFTGGSRVYSSSIEELITASRQSDKTLRVEFGDRKEFDKISLSEARDRRSGKVHVSAIREAFPVYYVSPKKRGYVVPEGPYIYDVEVTAVLAEMLNDAIRNPAAPLYLGSNDGWVDAKWKTL